MFNCSFSTENDSFMDAPASEVGRLLREIARQVELGAPLGGGPIRDANGNTIGHWDLTPYGRGSRRARP